MIFIVVIQCTWAITSEVNVLKILKSNFEKNYKIKTVTSIIKK